MTEKIGYIKWMGTMKAESIDVLYERMSEADLRIIERGTELLRLECDLISQVQKYRDITEAELDEVVDIRDSALSQLEYQHDALLFTLERYVVVLGGKLELLARFDDRSVPLTQFVTDPGGRSRKTEM